MLVRNTEKLIILILLPISVFGSGSNVFKNTKMGYTIDLPPKWVATNGYNDSDNKAEQSRYVNFNKKECEKDDCWASLTAAYPSIPKKTFEEMQKETDGINADLKKRKGFKVFESQLNGKQYSFVVQKIDANWFRTSTRIICDKNQIYSFQSGYVFDGSFEDYFKEVDSSTPEKVLTKDALAILKSFKCPSDDFVKSKKYNPSYD